MVYIYLILTMSNAFAFYLCSRFCTLNTVNFFFWVLSIFNTNHHHRAMICPDGYRFACFFNTSKFFYHSSTLRITTFYHRQGCIFLLISLKVRLQHTSSICGKIVKDTIFSPPWWCPVVSGKTHRAGPLMRENQLPAWGSKSRGWSEVFFPCLRIPVFTWVPPRLSIFLLFLQHLCFSLFCSLTVFLRVLAPTREGSESSQVVLISVLAPQRKGQPLMVSGSLPSSAWQT